MNEPHTSCPRCGSPVTPDLKFCGECGQNLTETAAGQTGGPTPEHGPSPRPAGSSKRTMLGMPAAQVDPAQGAEGASGDAPDPATSGPQGHPSATQQDSSEREADTPPEATPDAPQRGPRNRTMLGMPTPDLSAGAGQSEGAEQPNAAPEQTRNGAGSAGQGSAQPNPEGAAAPARSRGSKSGTMLGMPAPGTAGGGHAAEGGSSAPGGADRGLPAASGGRADQTPPQGSGHPDEAPDPSAGGAGGRRGRTIQGMPPAGMPPQGSRRSAGGDAPAAPAEPAPPRERAQVSYQAASSGSMPRIQGGVPRKSGSRVALILVGIILLGTVISLSLFVAGMGDPEVRAKVVQTDRGEALQVELPQAPEGARVRFDGEERELEAGRARFPLTADALDVGQNEIVIDVLGPEGEQAEQVPVTLTLSYRVYTDLSELDADPPAITVHVEARPGSKVMLDGKPLRLGEDGHASRRFELKAQHPSGPNAKLEHSVRYAINAPDGDEADQGRVRTEIPYTSLQIDRPGPDVVTDRKKIEIAGAAHAKAKVTIEGTPVEVTEGRFVHDFPLPETGTYTPTIVARRSGFAPRREELTIRRVEDLEQEAAEFDADPSLTYARIDRNPNVYKGRKVEFTGRVYNVGKDGDTHFLQMLVRQCSGGQRCSLWVVYRPAHPVTRGNWVRVLGKVAGKQQFRSESGAVREVPRVDATFVIPTKRDP